MTKGWDKAPADRTPASTCMRDSQPVRNTSRRSADTRQPQDSGSRPTRSTPFVKSFANYTAENHSPTERELELRIDAEIMLDDLTHRAVRELDRIGPFGCANRRPQFAASGVQLVEPPKRMGGGERHLSLRLRQSTPGGGGKVFRAVAFGKGDWADEIEAAGESLAISFVASINEFRGYERVELQLTDWHPAPAPAAANS